MTFRVFGCTGVKVSPNCLGTATMESVDKLNPRGELCRDPGLGAVPMWDLGG